MLLWDFSEHTSFITPSTVLLESHGRHTHIFSTCAVECRLCLTPVCCCTARVEGELVLSGALVVELRKPVCRGNAGVVEGIDSSQLCIRHLFIHLHIPAIPASTTLSIYVCARPRSCWGTLTVPSTALHPPFPSSPSFA